MPNSTKKDTSQKITPTTKRLMVGGLSAIALVAVIGAIFDKLDAAQAIAIISPITTGFFAVMKGE